MAQKKNATTDQDAIAAPVRVKLRNTKQANGEVGAIATPLQEDAAKWRVIGWVDAD